MKYDPKEPVRYWMKIRDIVETRLAMQGFTLHKDDSITNDLGVVVAFYEKAEWKKYPSDLDLWLKLNQPIEFILLDFEIKV